MKFECYRWKHDHPFIKSRLLFQILGRRSASKNCNSNCHHPCIRAATKGESETNSAFPALCNNQVQMRAILHMEGTVQVSSTSVSASGERSKQMVEEEKCDQDDGRWQKKKNEQQQQKQMPKLNKEELNKVGISQWVERKLGRVCACWDTKLLLSPKPLNHCQWFSFGSFSYKTTAKVEESGSSCRWGDPDVLTAGTAQMAAGSESFRQHIRFLMAAICITNEVTRTNIITTNSRGINHIWTIMITER